MFRKLLVMAFIISLTVQAKLSWGENYTFRFTRWGMTSEEVIASELNLELIEKGENFITTYQKFKRALAKKYGPAKRDELIWLNDTYRNVSSKRGLALSLGHVKYLTFWETPDTTITGVLKEDKFSVNCSVEYSSKELAALQQEPGKEAKLDPF